MMFMNVGTWDRAIRIVAAIALGYAAWVSWTGAVSLVFLGIGAIALVTGLMGWCPLYALFGLSTNKRIGA